MPAIDSNSYVRTYLLSLTLETHIEASCQATTGSLVFYNNKTPLPNGWLAPYETVESETDSSWH